MSQSAVALGELLGSADSVIDGPTSYLIGQLASELVTAASDQELRELIVATHEPDGDGEPSERQAVLAMLSGFLQGLLGQRRRAATADSPATVRERVLNLVAIGPRNPSSLAAEIGCSMATASRALSRLRKQGLVELTAADSALADRRHAMYQLTAAGEQRQDDRFLGRPTDESPEPSDDENEDDDDGQLLELLQEAIAALLKRAPDLATQLSRALAPLPERVEDPRGALRARRPMRVKAARA
jgi:DNA-binding MarR family transcriptional regulator